MPSAERRDQLLDIAARLILDEGYQSVSIDRVAREAGIARTVIYAQFENLDGLHGALRDRSRSRISEQIAAVLPELAAAGSDDVDQLVIDAFSAFLDAVAADPVTWRLALMPRDGAPASLRDRVVEDRAAIVALLSPACRAGLGRRGGPAGIDPELLAHLIVASGEEAARMLLDGPVKATKMRLISFVSTALASLQT
jgi:AcrR family transcriptional regulator